MNGYRSSILTTAPPTLEKQLEVIEAIRKLAARNAAAPVFQQDTELVAIRRDFERLRHDWQELSQTIEETTHEWRQLGRSCVQKYRPDQPRVSAGNPDGGQWTSNGERSSLMGPTESPTNTAETRVAAAGDFRCEGFSGGCQSGGSYGTSGMYYAGGRVLCIDCAIKMLGIGNESSAEKTRTLNKFLINK